jgi:hypothetical protein
MRRSGDVLKFSLLALILCLGDSDARAQASDPYIISRQGSVMVQPLFQQWSIKGGLSFSEFGTSVSVYLPLNRSTSVSLRGGQALSGGDVSSLSGMTDMQVGIGYYWETLNAIVSCGINIPSGKKELTDDEFVTSLIFSSPIFNFRYPSFGQGIGINPGIAWVFPVDEGVVLGLGGAYQYKGKYRPRTGIDEDYKPGDEILLTGGVDFRLNEISTFSTDVVFTTYGTDKIGDEEVFASGVAISANVQYKQYFKENELWLFLRYRSKAKSEVGSATGLVPESERIEPNRFEFLGQYRIVFNSRFSARLLAEARIFEETGSAFSGAKLFGIGVAPVFTLPSGLNFPGRLKFQIGTEKGAQSITGFEIGVGIGYSF